MPTPHETAKIAVHACLEDLKLRGGFRELIASIPDWADCEKACVMRVEQAITGADFMAAAHVVEKQWIGQIEAAAAAPAVKPQQETLEFA